ncbi:VWA domain-containing protein [Luteolibacter ambystomatis]|uniref:VWA domain-containing protein n=1 Tax=Luteolibacter ambystomatis TaxID=2824561 RepID=A0A975G5I1_9BACT|nr:VWA domain-containing protein [Luteolibacter ambystomatis]QUE49479.1 VWA domain-containing protein [Luteolibacter ambystomatis]
MTLPVFQAPEWFLLIPALALLGWFWRPLKLHSPLRALILLIITLILADPRMRRQQDALDLWVLLDRSDSTESIVDQGLPEWRKLLEKSKPSRHDTLHFVNYAAEVVELGKDGDTFTGSRKLTRTNLALENIAAMADEKKPSRVLVFTDGFSTEPLHESAAQLESRGIPVDFRLIREETEEDFRIARLEFPERVQAGEPFLLGVIARGSKDITVPLVLRRNGQKLTETTVTLVNGAGKVEFTDRIPRTGSFEYEAEILPEKDAHPGNNRFNRWIEIAGGPRIVLATRYADDPVAKVLETQDFTVQTISDPGQLRPGLLAGARAVVFNNIPAHEVPTDFLKALDFYVREQGGGFLMVGGERSFGSGGYFQSAIDPLLPVSMELKTEHRKLSVALAIAMDRSGSMSVNVAGGVTKMDLADNGAANAIELLGPMDQVSVIAVDSAPEVFVPMSRVENHKKEFQTRARKIRSEGGGIFIYEALKAGWDQLKKTNVGTRHMILFADANDSEEPGDYKKLLAEMTSEGCTVTMIGMGTKKDQDSALLEDIAKLGNGRIYFAEQPMDIPNVFSQETVTIARSAFVKDPVGAKATGRWTEVSPKPLDWLAETDGYNLSYAREDATVSLVTTDEYLAPLVAQARRGLGRTAAISFPLGGEFSEKARAWSGYGDFVQTVTRWLMGNEVPPGIGIRHRLDGTRLTVDLLYDEALWSEKLAAMPPRIKLVEEGGVPYDVAWKRIAPGHFSVTRDLEAGSVVRGAIQVGSVALPFGPISVGASVEWAFEPERIAELRAVSTQTGGRELLNLENAWLRPPFIHEASLKLPLAIALMGLILAEALFTRTGWKLPAFSLPAGKRVRTPRPARVAKSRTAASTPVVEEMPEPEADDQPVPNVPQMPPTEDTDRRSRFQRAKDRR